MDEPVEHPAFGRVCLTSVPDARRADIIRTIADVFVDMGASSRDAEVTRLVEDAAYFDTWALDLPLWCPQVAFFATAPDQEACTPT